MGDFIANYARFAKTKKKVSKGSIDLNQPDLFAFSQSTISDLKLTFKWIGFSRVNRDSKEDAQKGRLDAIIPQNFRLGK